MKGKIKSITIHRYDYVLKSFNDEEIDIEGFIHEYREFDENGNEIIDISYNPAEEIQDKTERDFDDKGNVIEEKYFDGEELAHHHSFERDDDGKALKEFLHYLDGSKDTIRYEYDGDANLLSKTTMDEDDYVEKKEDYTYKDGKVTSFESFEEDELIRREAHQYDEKGHLTESTVEDNEREEFFRVVHEYENDKRVRSYRYDTDDELIEKLEFRHEGDQLKLVIQELPGEKNISQYEYDSKGNVVMQEEINKDNETNTKVERKFDEEGNILETKVYLNMHGHGIDRNYILKYAYEYFE